MHAILERQKLAQLTDGSPSAAVRIDRLDRAIGLLVDHAGDIADALRDDFGHRSVQGSLITDVAASIDPLKHAKKHVKRWMRRAARRVSPAALALLGARAWVDYQPKGVVGLISPWNFPFNLTFSPLAGILAAGNRAMIKPSEFTPRSSALMQSMIAKAFGETEIAVITGDSRVGEQFSALPFDHLIFTGATSVARHVMRAAAENLVPVTLELGGKSPAIVGRDADLDLAAKRLMFGKTLNAGQVCVSPDYALVPSDRVEAFVDALQRAVVGMFPTLSGNPDYTSIVNVRHHERLLGYLADATAKGATLRPLGAAGETFDDRRLAPTVVLGVDDEMDVLREEIFGPILPVIPYDGVDDAIAHINAHARPLSLYYFGNDRDEQERVLARTIVGGVTLNDTILHLTMDDLPFGGIGPSGMGAYHGVDGFRTFSHARSVYRQARFDVSAMLRPPYGKTVDRLLGFKIRR
ncbi:coniferyl aldehyde dehydrogenase [Luteibacter rhizovicinus DSM 16549]|uniref:Aldehyde dehydrogenase n=1 Tax=Luteibacter rhizovicinus DSM 16549 TaxID=1440763 RepID=A0A0G9H635_9GAMM|nr:coniferyl aldehyde dehydrogenase [Luteibacter rhizovicinus]APG03377.1 coniferyl aldehyde dehydrogenase [Luteibacter rhizovicinus DSM 16549]KLD65285.1 aldehyde dehydrogenase [Luteibacter rhizovicinus DSM 16549]KLD73275.1 aldehyde dehydrogenase [Xanthomonas hyacinthi DSM 19077]